MSKILIWGIGNLQSCLYCNNHFIGIFVRLSNCCNVTCQDKKIAQINNCYLRHFDELFFESNRPTQIKR